MQTCSPTRLWMRCWARSRWATSANTSRTPTPRWAGADSIALLQQVAALVREHGYVLCNLDATVLAQAPKLAPHIQAMRENLAAAIGCGVDRVSVKATTEEGLGFTGAKQGIAAHCVCLLDEI